MNVNHILRLASIVILVLVALAGFEWIKWNWLANHLLGWLAVGLACYVASTHSFAGSSSAD